MGTAITGKQFLIHTVVIKRVVQSVEALSSQCRTQIRKVCENWGLAPSPSKRKRHQKGGEGGGGEFSNESNVFNQVKVLDADTQVKVCRDIDNI